MIGVNGRPGLQNLNSSWTHVYYLGLVKDLIGCSRQRAEKQVIRNISLGFQVAGILPKLQISLKSVYSLERLANKTNKVTPINKKGFKILSYYSDIFLPYGPSDNSTMSTCFAYRLFSWNLDVLLTTLLKCPFKTYTVIRLCSSLSCQWTWLNPFSSHSSWTLGKAVSSLSFVFLKDTVEASDSTDRNTLLEFLNDP